MVVAKMVVAKRVACHYIILYIDVCGCIITGNQQEMRMKAVAKNARFL